MLSGVCVCRCVVRMSPCVCVSVCVCVWGGCFFPSSAVCGLSVSLFLQPPSNLPPPSSLPPSTPPQNTPLHLAAEKGHVDVIRVLIKFGASTEALNYRHFTPLHRAAHLGTCCPHPNPNPNPSIEPHILVRVLYVAVTVVQRVHTFYTL